jgi:hypothetical protein
MAKNPNNKKKQSWDREVAGQRDSRATIVFTMSNKGTYSSGCKHAFRQLETYFCIEREAGPT